MHDDDGYSNAIHSNSNHFTLLCECARWAFVQNGRRTKLLSILLSAVSLLHTMHTMHRYTCAISSVKTQQWVSRRILSNSLSELGRRGRMEKKASRFGSKNRNFIMLNVERPFDLLFARIEKSVSCELVSVGSSPCASYVQVDSHTYVCWSLSLFAQPAHPIHRHFEHIN